MHLYRKVHTPQALIKDVSIASKKVTGYLASFDNKDSDGDVFIRGAFAKSIRESGPGTRLERIAYLYQHSVRDIIGKFSMLEEQMQGLYFEADMVDTTLGLDTLKLYASGALKEHSVGIRIIQEGMDGNTNYIREAKLWEGSAVTWGANEETPFTGFKSLTKEQAIAEMDTFIKAIRNGTFTDETFNLLEIGLEQIKSHIDSLGKPEPSTSEPDFDAIGHFRKQLHIN